MTKVSLLVLLAALVVGLPAQGQSPADLLQKGIYTQETVGDLDGAIKIYRQIINSASQSRTYAAQAQYRLGLCLLKKGLRAEATKSFEKLVQDYPEEKELIAKAREYLPSETKLLPIPWQENELSEFHSRLANGAGAMTTLYSIEPAPGNPQTSVILVRGYSGSTPIRLSRVEIDRESMRPISLLFRIMGLDDHRLDYQVQLAHIRVGNQEPKTVTFEEPVFDNEELPFVFRRLPLEVGYKNTVRVLSPEGLLLNLAAVVPAMEDVQVPAGKFHCYRLEFPEINQTFWIGSEASRPLVKFASSGVSVELVSLGKVDRQTPVRYQDAKVGLSFIAPPGWITQTQELPAKDETSLIMLDPESKISVVVRAKETKTASGAIVPELRATAEQRVERRSDVLTDYHIRPETIEMRQIGGQQALTCVAEYLHGEQKMAEYLNWIRSENTNALFTAFGPATDLDEFRKRLDPIVETAKIK